MFWKIPLRTEVRHPCLWIILCAESAVIGAITLLATCTGWRAGPEEIMNLCIRVWAKMGGSLWACICFAREWNWLVLMDFGRWDRLTFNWDQKVTTELVPLWVFCLSLLILQLCVFIFLNQMASWNRFPCSLQEIVLFTTAVSSLQPYLRLLNSHKFTDHIAFYLFL